MKKTKAHDLNALNEDLNQKDAENKFATNKALFPKWTVARMQKEAIKKVEPFWLEHVTSFSVQNEQQ